ncbi:unnamed protein product [Paramecium sonneborni]|uniref:MIR domain-containing protein n=1 Tax=Paramecium sonneborni TaxID=65129 RepID=A0A8S1LEV5_9CILI|nr:unnamed protein product [Paramecium sonneborni]
MSNKGESLKFGQVISISPLANQSLFVYSDGLVKTDAKLVEISPEIMAAGSLYYYSLFRIYPDFITSKLQMAVNFKEETMQDDNSKQMQKLKDLQTKIIADYKSNIDVSAKYKDKPLSFNNLIQFMHVATNRFLSLSNKEAKEEKENFRLELVEYPSSKTIFQLQPAFVHQKESNSEVYAGDSVYIMCDHIYLGIKPKLRATLKYGVMDTYEYLQDRSIYAVPNLKLLKKMTDQLAQQQDILEITPTIQKFQKVASLAKGQSIRRQTTLKQEEDVKPIAQTSEVNISLEHQSPWVLTVFCNQNDNEQIISFNDVIWIHHIEENSLLTLGRNQDNELIITFQKQSNEQQGEFNGDSNGMFQIENEDLNKGGLIEWGQSLRLRHFILGKYLAINYEPIKSGQLLLYLSDQPTPNTLFQFVAVPTMGSNAVSQKYVTKDAFMKIKAVGNSSQWVHIEQKKILQANSKYKDTVVEEDKSVLVIRLTDNTEDDDVLKLYKANYSDVLETNFLITGFPVLRRGLTKLKVNKDMTKEAQKQQMTKIYKKLTTTIEKLEQFCINSLINTQLDIKNTKVAILQRQKILREQYFIDLLIEIMKYITNEDELRQYSEYQLAQHKAALEKQTKNTIVLSQRSHIGSNISPLKPNKDSQINSLNQIAIGRSAASQLVSSHTTQSQQKTQARKKKLEMAFLSEKMSVLKVIYRLLRSICSDNPENQFYIYKLFPNFLYQIKYFKEATDCIITVLSGNEQILINLCDQIKLNEKLKARQQIDSDESQLSDEMDIKFNSSADEKKNILLYYKNLTEDSQGQRNIQYLQFFRCICRLNDQSISVNQEMIFKFIKQNENFKSSLFMPIIIESTKMKIYVDHTQIAYLTSIKDSLIKNYLIEQLFLYADLAYQRNFLWKSYLERIFPTQFIFDQVFDDSMSIEYRSAFCNMAITIYVDHEPFNKAIVPNLCRLYTETKPISKSVQSLSKLEKLVDIYKPLVQKTFEFLEILYKKLNDDLEYKKDPKYKINQNEDQESKKGTKQKANQNDEEIYINPLVLDITKLISIMIRFDMLKIMKRDELYIKIVPKLITLLEYDKNNLLYSYILKSVKESKIEKAKERINLNVIGNVTAQSQFMKIAKDLASSILGIPPKQQRSLEDEFSDYDTTVIARNPIVSSLISIISYMDTLGVQETNSSKNQNQQSIQSNFEIEIQKEVCGILLYFQDQRQDFYVSNFIQFYKNFTNKFQQFTWNNTLLKDKFLKDLESELVQALPPFLKTGIETIDKQAQTNIEAIYKSNDMNELIGVGNLLAQSKKFQIQNSQLIETIDLDKLISGETQADLQLLPSLIVTFFVTNDFGLQNELIELMRRSFSQVSEMMYHLNRIELLFDKVEIGCYQFLEVSIQELKVITECSEVWLVDFLASPQGEVKEIQKIFKILGDLQLLLKQGTSIDHKSRVVNGTDQISLSRQKIFNFLNVYEPLLNFIRDTQQQLVKVLDDPFYSMETKGYVIQLLKALFALLRDFCDKNDENQKIMHKNATLFMDELQHDYGQMNLLSAIYRDNKQLCQKIDETQLKKIKTFIYSYGRQARFLHLYKNIQTYKNNPIIEVQTKVLQLFIPQHISTEDYTDINEFYLYGEFKAIEGRKVLEFTFEKSQETKLCDQPYLYHSEILQVLLATIIGEESFKINSPKLKKLFKLHYLLELLLQPDDFLSEEANILEGLVDVNLSMIDGIKHIKPQIIELANLLYVNNKVTDLYLFIKEQHTFTQFFAQEKNRLVKIQSFQGNFDSYLEYFFDYVIVLMKYYSKKVITKDSASEYRERSDYMELKDVMNIILGMCNTMIQHKLKVNQYNNLVEFVHSLDEQTLTDNAGQISQSLQQQELAKPQIEEENQIIFTQKKKDSPLIHVEKQEKLKRTNNKTDIDQLNQEIVDWNTKRAWERFLEECQQLQSTKKTQSIEMRILSQTFQEVHKFVPDAMIKELSLQNFCFKDFLKKLIRFIEVGIINQANKSNLIYTLQLLEDILDSKDDLEKIQNEFDQCQATRMFLNLLADFQVYPFDDDLLIQLFKFALKLSKNGNQRIQTTVFNYFSNFEKSEMIFLKMNQIIYEVINENKKTQQLLIQQKSQKDKDQHQKQLYLSNIQEQQNEDESTSKEAQEVRRSKMSILIYLLKYFQLICEGHNLQIQNYLRQQYNSRNNYNIVQAMVELLCAFENDLQRDSFEVIMNTLETLTELVQGPCSQNQQDIIDSLFLDVASNYLNMHIESKKKKDQDGSQDKEEHSMRERSNSLQSKSTAKAGGKVKTIQIDRWMLERLKYKCMVLVSSLLELNSDTNAIKRILRSLPINVLKKNLIIIYKKHQKMYKKLGYNKESLGHLEENPHVSTKPPEYHELILETGFLIYFLINHYANLDTKEIDPATRDELEEIKESQKNSEKEDPWAQLQNSLIGQLASLVFSLVGGILEMINEWREYAQQQLMKQFKGKESAEEEEKRKTAKKLAAQQLFNDSIMFFQKNSATVEVIRDQQLEKIIFYKLSFCNYLPQETKTEFHETVDRDSTNSKVSALVENMPNFMDVAKHEEELTQFFNQNKFVALFAKYVILWKDLCFLLTLVLNVFIVLSYYEGDSDDPDQRFYDRLNSPKFLKMLSVEETMSIFRYCGIGMIVCSCFVVSFFILKKGPLYVKEAWNQSKDLIKEDQIWIIKFFLKLYMVGFCLVKVLLNIDMIYYLTYGVLAFIATLFHPFFFAFHLSEVVLRYPTLRNIIKSFWEPKVALGLTFILVLLMNYYFTLMAYLLFYDIYTNGKCDSLLVCFLSTFDYAFKNNGGIGGWFDGNFPQDPADYSYGRFFFDQLNNILIQMISIQIFSGIIIDTFGELREQQLAKEDDKENICFICGLDREIFDMKSDDGFNQHTKQSHYMWNYVFYMAYMDNKNKSEYNGIETYIANKRKNQDNSWFPIGQSLELQEELEDQQMIEEKKISNLQQRIDGIKLQSEKVLQILNDIQEQVG